MMRVSVAVLGPDVKVDPEAQVGRSIKLHAGPEGAVRVTILAARRNRNGWLEIDVDLPPSVMNLIGRNEPADLVREETTML